MNAEQRCVWNNCKKIVGENVTVRPILTFSIIIKSCSGISLRRTYNKVDTLYKVDKILPKCCIFMEKIQEQTFLSTGQYTMAWMVLALEIFHRIMNVLRKNKKSKRVWIKFKIKISIRRTIVRRTLFHVPTEDFYWEIPLKTDTSKVRNEFYSNRLNSIWNRV